MVTSLTVIFGAQQKPVRRVSPGFMLAALFLGLTVTGIGLEAVFEGVPQFMQCESHAGQVRRGTIFGEGVSPSITNDGAPAQVVHIGNARFHLWQRLPFIH